MFSTLFFEQLSTVKKKICLDKTDTLENRQRE